MRYQNTLAKLSAFVAALPMVFAGLAHAQTKAADTGTTTFTVTAVGKKEAAPAISKDDVQLFLGKERKQIGDWKKDDNLFLAILIDDSIDNGAASNWNDLKEFIMAQPAIVHIAVGYIRNNSTMLAQVSPRTTPWPRKPCACRWAPARSAPAPSIRILTP